MKAKTELAALPKSAQKVARQYAAAAGRRIRDNTSTLQLVNTGVGFGSALGAAAIDHKFRKGAESVARIGEPGSKFRPQVNATIALAATVAGVFGGKMLGKYAGTALAVGLGTGGPALYNWGRAKFDEP